MNKLNTLLFFFSILSLNLYSQNIVRQVIGSTGNASSSGPYVLHSTVGQPPLAGTTMPQSSLTGYTYILRQGFQQPFKFHNLWISSVSNNYYTHTTIFPNPARNFTKIVSDKEMLSLVLINRTGNIVIEQKIKSKEIEINTSKLAAGAYIIQIHFDLYNYETFQFIIQ